MNQREVRTSVCEPPVFATFWACVARAPVSIDDIARSMRLYVRGVEVKSVDLASDLAAIEGIDNWLGRFDVVVDPALFGTSFEFRIYDQALSAAQIGASFQAGPGALN